MALVTLSLLLIWTMAAAPALGQGHRRGNRNQKSRGLARRSVGRAVATPSQELFIEGRTVAVPDAWVVKQDGKRVRFYSGLLKGKAVALGFFYTSCVYVCTLHGKQFSEIQRHVGQRLGKEVFLVSVSMDPLTDTPATLREWGATYGRQEGWTLVTGEAAEINKILKALTGNSVGPRESHSSFFYVVDETGRWRYMFETASPAEVERQMRGGAKHYPRAGSNSP
jgi:cytochrome oxidase Cu insertion factor (SCO1/SenC/PrrC family)